MSNVKFQKMKNISNSGIVYSGLGPDFTLIHMSIQYTFLLYDIIRQQAWIKIVPTICPKLPSTNAKIKAYITVDNI